MPSVKDLSANLKAAGVKLDFVEGKNVVTGNDICWVYSPDDVKVELHGPRALPDDLATSLHVEKPLTVPIVGAHIHFAALSSSMTEMQGWYAKTFGGTGEKTLTGVRIRGIAGGSLSVGKAPKATVPTKGRALDSIGFEIKNLEAFSKKLEANGMKVDEPYSKTRHKSFASAKFTDPFGVSIELTEGLRQF